MNTFHRDEECDNVLHVIFTSEANWNLSVLDIDIDDDENVYDFISDIVENTSDQ